MPIYMDRHDVAETVTAEIVAQIHQEDLKIQDQFGCKGLTYWFDDKRKAAFCLIEAPDTNSIREMHQHAHGQVPHTVIEVDTGLVESFLGRIADPAKAQDGALNIIEDPAFRIIIIIGVRKLLPQQNGSTHFLSRLDHFNKAVIDILNSYGEKPARQTEGKFLVSFRSASTAVQAALDIQTVFKKKWSYEKQDKISLRIALGAGVPVTEKKSFFEDTIKLVERMCESVDGEVILSSEVEELYNSENSNRIPKGKKIVILTPEDEKFLTVLMDYMETTWANPNLKVDDFCRPLGCSKSQLYRKMISLTAMSPNIFIREYRLARALKLLNKNSGNVSEIAFETGFTSPSYFSKCFQKRYGYQPSYHLHSKKD